MKKKIFLLPLLGIALVSCQTRAGTGALVGGGAGATTGALIAGGKGVIIGGAVGGVTGALVGASLDDQDRKIMEESSPSTVRRMDRGEPITVNDIVKLSQGGVSDDTIIRYIQQTGTSYNLNQNQIDTMQQAGVSQRVINYMIGTGY